MRKAVDDLGQTIVMVTHDPIAAGYADRVVFLADGAIVDELLAPTRRLGARQDEEPGRLSPCGRSRSRASGQEGPLPAHRHRGDAGGRVRVGHVRAHRDDLQHLQRPVQRHLPAHRRGRAGQGGVQRPGLRQRGSRHRQRRPAADGPRRARASPRPTARCRAWRSSSTRRATRSAATGQGAPTLGFSFIHDRELSTIHVVRGSRSARPRRGRHRQGQRRRRRLQGRRHGAGHHQGRAQRLHAHRHREVRQHQQPARRDHRRVRAGHRDPRARHATGSSRRST